MVEITCSRVGQKLKVELVASFVTSLRDSLDLLPSSADTYIAARMTVNSRKRISNLVDLVNDDSDAPVSKASRTASPSLNSLSTGQRFGESTDFIPLNQLSQATSADEEDAQAADLIPGSQDGDESSSSNSILYGTSSCVLAFA